MDVTDRSAAWDAVHEALPARWSVGPCLYSPEDGLWHVSAIGPHPGRGKLPQAVRSRGEDELAALRDLDEQLRGVPRPDGGRMEELERRIRLAYVSGAEERSQQHLGRGGPGRSEREGGVRE